MSESTAFGFRRRCAWCGVQLRGWQLNLCHLCGSRAKGSAGIYLSAGGPPCSPGSRWEAEPDTWLLARADALTKPPDGPVR